MQIPFGLSASGITEPNEIYPALDIYADISKQHHERGNTESENAAMRTVNMQMDLLRLQPYVRTIIVSKKYDSEWLKENNIIDTDYQRQNHDIIDMGRGDILWRNCCQHRCLRYWNAYNPWLYLPDDNSYDVWRGKIIVNSTPRYANNNVTWRSLHKYADRCVFIGLKKDLDMFYYRSYLMPEYYEVKDFIDMAQVIKHCAFFVGSQSFPACLAESMKVNRIIVQAVRVPDLLPKGGVGNAIVTEDDFEITLQMYADEFL